MSIVSRFQVNFEPHPIVVTNKVNHAARLSKAAGVCNRENGSTLELQKDLWNLTRF